MATASTAITPAGKKHLIKRRDAAYLSDEALIALLTRRDDQALAELYDRYSRAAYSLALRVLRDPAVAEDAVQDAFLTLWRTANQFLPGRGKPSTWILTLTHRRAVDIVRREQHRKTEPLETVKPPEHTDRDTHEQATLRERRRTIQQALRKLPDPEREALELAYYAGFTQTELADRLALPLGTIKSRMYNGLRRLRDTLTDTTLDTGLTIEP